MKNSDRSGPQGPSDGGDQHFEPEWESLSRYVVPRWYRDAKFGIFIHWGVYCVPAFGNEWYPRNMYVEGTPEYEHHLATYGSHLSFGYKDFIPLLRADQFDAEEWANLFRLSGAQFVVPVAEHHDGFAMYDSGRSRWTAARLGPKRDIIGELASAVRAQSLTFGVSSHRAEHWWFYNGGMKYASDVQESSWSDFYGPAASKESQPTEEYLEDWLARCCEIVDKYQPQLVWFDWWIEEPAFRPYLRRFAAYYYNRAIEWKRGVVINYKHGAFPEDTAVFDVERGQLSEIRLRYWQTDTSISKNSWGYIEGQEYKQADEVIRDLVDIVSKNGALLLNIGPRSDGTIPEAEREVLLEIGRWLEVNGEAVYATRPWTVYGEGPTKVEGGSFTDTKRGSFTSRDVRFTAKGDTLYAIVLAWPDDNVVTIRTLATGLRVLTRSIANVELLGSEHPAKWNRTERGLRVALPETKPSKYCFALRITTIKQ